MARGDTCCAKDPTASGPVHSPARAIPPLSGPVKSMAYWPRFGQDYWERARCASFKVETTANTLRGPARPIAPNAARSNRPAHMAR
ncbi:hypothetical protein MRX96_037393 [Rhipicephalus microplus]